ncbi:MAG: GH32 C-terminal domain-containing protein [Sedimentisphaerales bacterium]|nr:GH32 C-terminal domain-containing protein [Sedimentisphaerales bacterium]
MGSTLIGILAFCLLLNTAGAGNPDILIADFEGRTYGDWQVEGQAFGQGPAQGTLPNQMNVSGFLGKGLVNSYTQGDDSTGALTSPLFIIQRNYIHFLIGGGMHPGKACINLFLDGTIVRTATGSNDRPGGSEALDWATWDVSDMMGKTVRIQIIDQQKGGWGHINIDHIIQSNEKMAAETSRQMQFTKRYLNLPVKTGAPKRRMKVIIDGQTVREFEIELADAQPDFWVFLDLAPFQGKDAALQVNALGPQSKALEQIHQADTITGTENLYREKNRQQFHFSSRRGWNNDSNGLVYYKGEYHLYYQHNPYGWDWGNMHWGHAVSTDLVHWKELPIAIYPHQFGDWVFSGSAVLDKDNTAGFKTGAEDVIVAAYTSTGRGEVVAYSNDRGRTFTDYSGNPVVRHTGRDPKVIWYEKGRHWVMALYSEIDNKRTIAFYASPNLKDWQYQSHIDGFFECPEIFELPVDGDKGNTRWVLYAADGNYLLGDFDGKTFTPDGPLHPFQYGNCFYASQTYNNIPASDGRRIQIAWGRIATPGMPFNQCMLFPVELTLRNTEEGIRMFAEPVREIETIHGDKHTWKKMTIQAGERILSELSGDLFHIKASILVEEAEEFGFIIRGTRVSYDVKNAVLSCRDKKAPFKPTEGKIHLELLIDRNSIEIFANNGRVYIPIGGILPENDTTLQLFSSSDATRIESLEIWPLHSIWERD